MNFRYRKLPKKHISILTYVISHLRKPQKTEFQISSGHMTFLAWSKMGVRFSIFEIPFKTHIDFNICYFLPPKIPKNALSDNMEVIWIFFLMDPKWREVDFQISKQFVQPITILTYVVPHPRKPQKTCFQITSRYINFFFLMDPKSGVHIFRYSKLPIQPILILTYVAPHPQKPQKNALSDIKQIY